MSDDVMDNLNAERRRQWDESKESAEQATRLAYEILFRHNDAGIKTALLQHLDDTRYPMGLKRRLMQYPITGAYASYVICHVAVILEPERKEELGL